MSVVFSAECNSLFDWHSAAIFYSFESSNFSKTASLTRLLACSEAEQAKYPKLDLEIGPTFVHRNLRNDPLVDETGYPSYNKPYSVSAWLAAERSLEAMTEAEREEDEYILMTDADMIFREPIDPVALGCARGVVVSAEYTYLVGTDTGFAERFIARDLVHKLAQVGGFHIFHREDLRLIAPKWLEFTKQVRAFAHAEPEIFFRESMAPLDPKDEPLRAVRQKQSKWHSEMYGYVFAAAEVGVTHHVRRDVMLYPGYQPFLGRGPNILHYGSDYTVNGIYFNKMSQTELKIETCPKFLFGSPLTVDWSKATKRDALCYEHLATTDAALCRFYKERALCDEHRMPEKCAGQQGESGEQIFRRIAREAHHVMHRCEDEHENCGQWQQWGECGKNPLFMHSTCARSCKTCTMSTDDVIKSFGDDVYHLGDWRWKAQHKQGLTAGAALCALKLRGVRPPWRKPEKIADKCAV